MKHPTPHNQGFTLVETLVAISILLMVTVVPMTQIQSGLKQSGYADEQNQATMLAQEGVELVRAVRDYDRLRETGDDFELIDECSADSGSAKYCTVDPFLSPDHADKLTICGGGSCKNKPLLMDSNGVYGYGGLGWSPSQFTRTIQVVPVDRDSSGSSSSADDERKVISMVTWETRLGTERSVIAEAYLSRFQQGAGFAGNEEEEESEAEEEEGGALPVEEGGEVIEIPVGGEIQI